MLTAEIGIQDVYCAVAGYVRDGECSAWTSGSKTLRAQARVLVDTGEGLSWVPVEMLESLVPFQLFGTTPRTGMVSTKSAIRPKGSRPHRVGTALSVERKN